MSESEITAMDIHEVLKYLPHRYPFVLVDRVVSYELGKRLTAIKNVTINEPFFQGHFPGRPVMPGVLMLEAMAQATCILAYKTGGMTASDKSLFYFAGIDNARFKRVVEPGDQLTLEVEVVKMKKELWKCHGITKVGDEVACSADLLSVRKEVEA